MSSELLDALMECIGVEQMALKTHKTVRSETSLKAYHQCAFNTNEAFSRWHRAMREEAKSTDKT